MTDTTTTEPISSSGKATDMALALAEPPTPIVATRPAVHSPLIEGMLAGLSPLDQLELIADFEDEVELLYDQRDADNTKATYKFAQDQYIAFCEVFGLPAMVWPTSLRSIALYLAWLVARRDADGNPTGVKWGTVGVRLAGITRMFYDNGLASPRSHPEIKGLLRGLKRTLAKEGRVAPRKVTAITLEPLRAMLDATRMVPVGAYRDAAMATLRGAGLDPAVLAELDWATYRPTPDGPTFALTDGTTLLVPAAGDIAGCPARAVAAWARAAGFPVNGPVFCHVDSTGRVTATSFGRQGITKALRRLADDFGLNPEGHAAPVFSPAAATAICDAILVPRLIDERDFVVLLWGWRTAMRRSNLADLRWGDLKWSDEGIIVKLRWTKTKQFDGQEIAVERTGTPLCQVAALEAWRVRLRKELHRDVRPEEPVFPKIHSRGGHLLLGPSSGMRVLGGSGIGWIVQTRAARAGLVGDYNGHSLRRGFITECVRQKIPLLEIQRVSGHATLDALIGYVEVEHGFGDRIGVRLGV